MINWLQKRLSGSQKKSERYVKLAEALEQYWEENFDPLFQDMVNSRSIYTASEEDLAKKIAELGDRFTADYPTGYDKPLALAWRRNEIKRKNTSFLLTNSFRRNFENLEVRWAPLWAAKNLPYGSEFKLDDELTEVEKNSLYFLTSRGNLFVNVGQIYALKIKKSDFLIYAERIVYKSKPEHIVYDGPVFYLDLPVDFNMDFTFTAESKRTIALYVMGYRFDDIAADIQRLDSEHCIFEGETKAYFNLDWAEKDVGIDYMPLFDEVSADFAPLDMVINKI